MQTRSDAPSLAAETVAAPTPVALGEQETLADTPGDARGAFVEMGANVGDRYAVGDEIGRGGMGVVASWTDRLIGREVAVKVLLDDAPRPRARFLREARTQGRLEHPSIAPVHDLAALPDGRPFFTMQRVQGHTLAAVLDGTALGDRARFSRRRVLEALARIALAVDFAHVRGVVHRDLKPANLMLGDFGEVYVLDWGIAREVGGERVDDDAATTQGADDGLTQQGWLLGTPGYMSPEQARGGVALDARTDVYALGCVLFEVLTGSPLHVGKRVGELLAPLDASVRSPAARAPDRDVPPELDALCLSATEPDRDARLTSARAMAEAIEQYLEGDRDLKLRTDAAQAHARNAARLCDRALGKGVAHAKSPPTEAEAEEARRAALLEVSRAVALRPDHPLALATLVALLTEPPKRVPHEVEVELADLASAHVRVGGRLGAVAYGAVAVLLAVLVVWSGKLGPAAWVTIALFAVSAAASFGFSRLARPTVAFSLLMLGLSTLSLASLCTFFGPLVGTPTAVCVNTLIFVVSNGRAHRVSIVAAGVAGTLLPLALELVGVLPPSFRFHEGTLVLLPRAIPFEPRALVAVGVCFAATVVLSAFALGPFRDDLDEAQKASRVLSWQLRQLVPTKRSADLPPR